MSLPPITYMAVITLVVAVLVWGGLLFFPARSRRNLMWLFLIGLPLSALVNLAVKQPLAVGVANLGNQPLLMNQSSPLWWIVFLSLLAPVTEELIKVLPLAIRPVRRKLSSPYLALWTGMALGISFGLGEAIYLAYGIARSPQFAGIPWYQFTGYLSERLIVILLHGMLTSFFVYGVYRKGWSVVGFYLLSVAGHTLINLGAILLNLRLISPITTQLFLLGSAILVILTFEWIRRRLPKTEQLLQDEQEVIHYTRSAGE